MKKIIVMSMLCLPSVANAQEKDSSAIAVEANLRQPAFSVDEALKKISLKIERMKTLVIPGVLIGYGFVALNNNKLISMDLAIKNEIREDHPKFYTTVDDYLQYAPAVAVYSLNISGIKGKHDFRDRTIIYLLSNTITGITVQSLKAITRVQRPDGYGTNAFPSGHTATAFVSAEFLWQEYKDVSPWYGIAGYAAAAATGILRMYNNKHWFRDILPGAGFGILSTKIAYWIYPSVKRKLFKDKPVKTMIMPYYQKGGGGFSLVYNFRP